MGTLRHRVPFSQCDVLSTKAVEGCIRDLAANDSFFRYYSWYTLLFFYCVTQLLVTVDFSSQILS